MILDEEDYLAHYGTIRKSGRYPWGSGDNETAERHKDFLDYVADMRAEGMNDVEISKGLGFSSTTSFRNRISVANSEVKAASRAHAQRLKDKGMSNVAAATQMGIPESTYRALIKPGEDEKVNILQNTANILKDQVAEKRFIDVGTGVETQLGINATKLNAAISILKDEGYVVHPIPVKQLGTGLNTNVKVLAPPGTTWGDVKRGQDQIQQIAAFSDDGGRSHEIFQPPLKINPDRVGINYKEDGGDKADGVIYVRPGVEDVSLGTARYAQVRVSVGDGHYLKGMAMYKDDLPDGVDLVFNTNKSDTGNKLDAMKKIDSDPNALNPYGSSIKRQIFTKNPDGTSTLSSSMNIIREEGNWQDWSKTISTQMLSKQSPALAKSQLNMTYEQRLKEFEDISSLTNPTVRKMLLEKFGDATDSSAVHLNAAAISTRQGWHAILPISSMSPNEVYAPNFENGERVVLIRFPHAGTFEIPELTVNNRQREAKKLLAQAPDAVGIHHSVAQRLSGADFDGDTVLVIPNNNKKITVTPAHEALMSFDPRSSYPKYDGMKVMTSQQKGIEMGNISNLITDMSIRKASPSEIVRAVKHSMVVIDAEKHELNYKQSAIDNGISNLKQKYQGKSTAGASTLISRATSEARIEDRKPRSAAAGGAIDKATGKREFVPTGKTNFKTGAPSTISVDKLSITDDAHTLSSGTPMERIYAEHSNKLKALANHARRESVNTPPAKYSASAKKAYANEVKSLDAKLKLAVQNRPLERQAQVIANTIVRAKKDTNPNMDKDTLKKEEFKALTEARIRTGAQKNDIIITQHEWDAIQAGAISDYKLQEILKKADIEVVKKLATPRPTILMSPTKTKRATTMLASGATRAEVAAALGVSITTLDRALSGGEG